MHKAWLYTFIATCATFFVIALPTYLCGCHHTIQHNCIRYWVAEADVVGYHVDNRTCSYCVSWGSWCSGSGKTQTCYSYCNMWNYYNCYDSYAILATNYTENCALGVSAAVTDYTVALTRAEAAYNINQTMMLYIDKNTGDCLTESNVEALAITGLVFVCAACAMLIMIMVWIWMAKTK